jgi:hypothetical protein
LELRYLNILWNMENGDVKDFHGHGFPVTKVRRHSVNSFEFIEGAPRGHGGKAYYDRFKMAQILARVPLPQESEDR